MSRAPFSHDRSQIKETFCLILLLVQFLSLSFFSRRCNGELSLVSKRCRLAEDNKKNYVLCTVRDLEEARINA